MKKRLMSMFLAFLMILMQTNVVAFAAEGVATNSQMTYDLEVGLWKADADEASMANAVFTGKSKLVESNGKKTMVVYAQPMTFMGITAYLEKLEVLQTDGSYVTAEITETDEKGNATAFSYEISDLTEYTNVLVYYGGRPTGSTARIKVLNYSELAPVTTTDLEVGLWKVDADEASMANAVFTGKSKLVESNGKKTMVVYAQPMTFMGITAYLEKLEVMQEDGSYVTAEITARDEKGNATAFSYEITDVTEFTNVLVYYGGRPTGSAARIKVLNYDEIAPAQTYPLSVALWHASKDAQSMGNEAFTGEAELVVRGSKTSIVVYTKAMEYFGITGYVQEFAVEEETGVYKEATVLSTDKDGVPTSFSFEVTKLQEYYNVKADAKLDSHPSEARLKILNYSDFVTGGDQEESTPDNTPENAPAGDALSKVENGVFEVAVDLYKETSADVSMAGDAVRKTARIQVVNGTATMYLYTKELSMAGLTASFKELQIKQADGTYVAAKAVQQDSNGTNTVFTFALPSYEEYIGVKVNAGIDFMGVQNARIRVDYTTLKEVDQTTDLTVFPGQATFSTVTVEAVNNQTFTGNAVTPAVVVKNGTTTLVEGTDYTVTYKNNVTVGTATVTITGAGNYTGTKEVTFKITAKSVADLSVSAIADAAYTGKAVTPAVTVKNGSTALKSGTDYTVSYSNNKAAGTASVKITGKGNYTGTKTVTFKITKRSISSATASKIANMTYTGSAIKPAVTLKYNGITLKKNTDYTLSYSNNKSTGKATITITGKGNFKGTKKVTFNIVPKKPVISKVASSKTKTATVTVKKVTGATGYQVSYATSKNGTYKVAGTTTKTSYNVTKLTKNKTVYVKVRAYKVIDGKKVYGSYSAVKSVKVK